MATAAPSVCAGPGHALIWAPVAMSRARGRGWGPAGRTSPVRGRGSSWVRPPPWMARRKSQLGDRRPRRGPRCVSLLRSPRLSESRARSQESYRGLLRVRAAAGQRSVCCALEDVRSRGGGAEMRASSGRTRVSRSAPQRERLHRRAGSRRSRAGRTTKGPDAGSVRALREGGQCSLCELSSSFWVTGVIRSSKNQRESPARTRCGAVMRPRAFGRIIRGWYSSWLTSFQRS